MSKVHEGKSNMLHSTTILAETATVAGATASTAKTAVKYEVNEKGEKTAILVNKKRAILGTTIGSSATTATYGFQQQSLNNTLNNVHNAQAYVESLSEERLAELSEMLEVKGAEFEFAEQAAIEEIETKQPYVKK